MDSQLRGGRMKTLLIYTAIIVCGIEYGCMAVDSFYDTFNAELVAFQEKVNG